ncbi:ExeA family protein [Desulfoscipio gibsoniae]|uniref:Type II secretory pathway, component ExeA (Predicted ATPase) n=1 Tax=Desulfoscipio gibsoniae DSM 7213 TaxID=767817 RepID=R4KKV2_9FIRM|nr:AAA family ATPase [Desulfoscipio gibsoniae]AGL01145.1 type II secretory pathway, component ExeA (predicted ATPase) [Desulfoscipio gibsoniae DSM 7213]
MNSPYFSFNREPFSRELSPKEVFVSKGHRELLARLRHVIKTGSLAVITGQVGSGKSTAIRSVMQSLEASRYRYIYLASSQLSPAEFYKSLLYQVNIRPSRGFSENKRLVAQAMLELHQKGIKPVVVIDEAQELTVQMLSEFRFVLNYQADSFSPLMVVLAGQPQLAEILRLQVLECIRQRINVHYRLPCLGEDEIAAYILHHLKVAGLDKQIFTDAAVQLIYQFSKGIPRRINNICRYAIVAAVVADSPTIDADAVQKGLEDDELI